MQSTQNANIDQLMGMMGVYSVPEPSSTITPEISHGDVDQFFDFGLHSDSFGAGDGVYDDGQGGVDIDELLRNVEADGSMQNGHKQGVILGSTPNTVAASPGSSSVGSRAREELEEEIEEVQPKRRRMN